MSLRTRINLIIALSMIVIIVVGAIFTIYTARKSVNEVISASMDLAMNLVRDGISEPLATQDPAKFWQSRIGLSAGTKSLRIRIILPDGRVVDYIGAWTTQPASAVPDWFVWFIKPGMLVKNQLIQTELGPVRVAIRGDPTEEITKSWKNAEALFGLIFLQALLVGVLVHFTLKKALRSVPVILKGLENIKVAKFSERLPDFDVPEFSKISAAFNHATMALEQAHRENRALASRTLSLQEEERRLLARELHDELGQSLTAIKMTASSITKESPSSQTAVDSIVSICDHLFSVVRSMMRRLRPTLLDDLGLAASLQDMVDNWSEQNSNTKVYLQIGDGIDACNETENIHLFRIVQEALNNIARHSQAKEVEVNLRLSNCKTLNQDIEHGSEFVDCISLTIKDDGKGFDANQVAPGFGLLGMRERVESLGGKFYLSTQPNQGVLITVEIPYGETPKWQLP